MSSYRYRAYLSYSHADEAWARWLHRALEAYRVPSALVGSRPNGQTVPARIAPIFRDRDDLSSSSSLSQDLQEALRDSESLIVVCSPSAAASRWVNEEIRYFLSLGRAERIFCVLVEGDPGAKDVVGGCFPPALITDQAVPTEPLAVDPRPHADGKELAKLKLVAGLVGVRLDDLRRRQLRRKRRWQALIATGALSALTLLVFAMLAHQAEQRERQSAEEMAGFIVDLGEELKSAIDLQALGLISTRAMRYLADLDPRKLRPETATKVGLALRQIGQVSDGQGREAEAREAFFRSRELFAELSARNPQDSALLFELGQAEFYVATHFFYSGQFDKALPRARRYAEISQELFDSDPANSSWRLELSYAATGLLAMEVESGGSDALAVLKQAERAVTLARDMLSMNPDDPAVISNYSDALAWAADARMLACEVEQALEARQETLLMAQRALQKSPGDNYRREAFAYAQSGVGVVDEQLGRRHKARAHWGTSIATIHSLWREDPSNEILRRDLQWRRIYLARSHLDDGETQAARELLDSILEDFPEVLAQPDRRRDALLSAEFQLAQARLAKLRDDLPALREDLQQALMVLDVKAVGTADTRRSADERAVLAALYHLWWDSFGALPPNVQPLELPALNPVRSCQEALSSARIAVTQERPERARDELTYLYDKGYRAADATALCRELGGCPLLESP